MKAKTVESLLNLVAHTEADYHFVLATEGFTISENRNYITFQALNNGSDYLLFVDDDMVFPNNTLSALIATGKRIVGTLSYSRMLPLTPTIEPLTEIKDTLFEAKAVGCGVMLVDTKVFKELAQPWFAMETFDSGKIKRGEDSYFCDRAREKGISVWCEPTIVVGHIGDFIFSK